MLTIEFLHKKKKNEKKDGKRLEVLRKVGEKREREKYVEVEGDFKTRKRTKKKVEEEISAIFFLWVSKPKSFHSWNFFKTSHNFMRENRKVPVCLQWSSL